MADPVVKVKVVKHKSLRAKLAYVGNAYLIAKNSDVLADLLIRRIKRRFVQGVDANGTPWEPYSDGTRPSAKGMLRNTETLLNSIQRVSNNSPTVSFNTGAGFRISALAKNERDGVFYGIVHNLGSSDGHVPQRNFMGVSSADNRAVVRKFKLMVDKGKP